MNYQNLIDFLLENAPSNILYRVKKEILQERTDSPEMISLQSQILNLPKVKKAFTCQRENGFFGSVIHGVYFDGFDSTVELLKKNGVELTDPHMVKARETRTHWVDYEKDHFYRTRSFDARRHGWRFRFLRLGQRDHRSHQRILRSL